MNGPFYIQRPRSRRVPVVVSCPHTGTEIPDDIAARMQPEVAAKLADTDWFVHQLYGFAPELGITLVHARYSRYVIDLNRDPTGQKLYADARQETGLVPLRTFAGEALYSGAGPDSKETRRRLDLYYEPYHMMLAKLLSDLRAEYRHVLLFEAHSIKRQVPSIRPEPFPDMILGDQKGKTALPLLSETALTQLRQPGLYDLSYNDPFMGGYLTRRFGDPAAGVSALQLEMAQDVYMDEGSARRDEKKEARVQETLRSLLATLTLNLRQTSNG